MSVNSLSAILNAPYANRIQLVFTGIYAPFTNGTRAFDPTVDVDVYVDGILATVQYFTVDTSLNRYLLFLSAPISPTSNVQVIHHMPHPVFHDTNGTILFGFATLASYSTSSGDTPQYPIGFPIQDQVTDQYYTVSVTDQSFNIEVLSPSPSYVDPIILIEGSTGQCYQITLNNGSLGQTKVPYSASASLFILLEDTNGRAIYTLTIVGGGLTLDSYTAGSPLIVSMQDPITSQFYALSVYKGSLRTAPISVPEPPQFITPVLLTDTETGNVYQINVSDLTLGTSEVLVDTTAPLQIYMGDIITGGIYSLQVSGGALGLTYIGTGSGFQLSNGFLVRDSSTNVTYTVSVANGAFDLGPLLPQPIVMVDPYKHTYYHLVVNNGSLQTVPISQTNLAVSSLPFTDISTSVSYLLEVVKGSLTLIS